MGAGSEALVLKVSADTSEVAAGLAPMERALDALEKEVDATRDAMEDLDKTDLTLDVKDQAIRRAREQIDDLRDELAREVTLGLSTRETEVKLRNLQTAVKRLTDTPAVMDVEVDIDEEELAGMESLREGARGLGEAFGGLDGSLRGFTEIGREAVPALADLNQTMLALRQRAALAGTSMSALGNVTSKVTGVMAGPFGLAIAAGVGLVAAFASNQEDAADATADFADQLDLAAGAMDRNNRALIVKSLNEQGALKLAEKFGVSTEDMVTALLNQKDALEGISGSNALYQASLQKAAGLHTETVEDLNTLNEAYTHTLSKVDDAAHTQALLERAIGPANTALKEQRDTLDTQTTMWDRYEREVSDSRKALDDIVGSLDILNGRFNDSREATSRYLEASDNLIAATKESKKSMDLHTETGRRNDAMVREQAKNIDDLARARLRDAETSGESSDQIVADYTAQRKQLIEMADKLGLSGTAAEEYVNHLLATPKELKTEVKAEGVEKAEGDIDHAARDRDTAINVGVNINVDKISQDIARGVRSGFGSGIPNISGSSVTPRASATAGLTLLQPRLYLDGRPIRAALRGDVASTVSAQLAATRTRGRL